MHNPIQHTHNGVVIYPATDNNNEVFAKIAEKRAAMRALDDECSKLRRKLDVLKIEEEKE